MSLTLFAVPPRVVNITKDLIVDEGRTVELFCIATGKPNPEITWRHILPSGLSVAFLLHSLFHS